jgi:Fe-S oxidoreductase
MTTPHTLQERSDFLARCTRCSQCKFVPVPRSRQHASACPSIDFGQWHAYSGGGQVIMAYGLLDGTTPYSEPMLRAIGSCTMCGNCDVSCKVNFGETVEPLDSLYALRARLVADGQSPAAHRRLVDNMLNTGNAAGAPRAARARWADALALDAKAAGGVMLHVGGELSCNPERWPALQAIVGALRQAGVALAHAGTGEGPSGALAFDLGYTDAARAFAEATVDSVTRSGAATLVTFSATALAAFRAIYPRLGVSFGAVRVLHITEYLLELLHEGQLVLQSLPSLQGRRIAYHDPCKLGRLSEPWQPHDAALDKHMQGILTSRASSSLRFGNGGVYEAPRALLRALGADLIELERHHGSSYCCGAGGGVKETVPQAAALAARARMAEVRTAGSATLVSSCSACSRHLAAHAGDDALQVSDLLELLGQALLPVRAPVPATVLAE